jgi:hypothetical protein
MRAGASSWNDAVGGLYLFGGATSLGSVSAIGGDLWRLDTLSQEASPLEERLRWHLLARNDAPADADYPDLQALGTALSPVVSRQRPIARADAATAQVASVAMQDSAGDDGGFDDGSFVVRSLHAASSPAMACSGFVFGGRGRGRLRHPSGTSSTHVLLSDLWHFACTPTREPRALLSVWKILASGG